MTKEYLEFLNSVNEYIEPNIIHDATNIEHGQWEVPFEALLLELIKRPFSTVEVDMQLIEKLAEDADIVEEGVLDPDTWEYFQKWQANG